MGKYTEILLIGAAGLVLYKLLQNPVNQASGIIGGVAGPYEAYGSIARAAGSAVSDQIGARSRDVVSSYNTREVQTIIDRGIQYKEGGVTADYATGFYQKSLRTAFAKDKFDVNTAILENTYDERVIRGTEYGTSPQEYFTKVFMPTNEEAAVRREKASSAISRIKTFLTKPAFKPSSPAPSQVTVKKTVMPLITTKARIPGGNIQSAIKSLR